MKKLMPWLPLVIAIPLLTSCGSSSKTKKPSKPKIEYGKDTNGLDILVGQFSHNIDQIWGVNELLLASGKDYVKYTDRYYTRSHISFGEGVITIETLGNQFHLQNAIVHTLLMGTDATGIDLFASGEVPISNNPFLVGQVVDQSGNEINNLAIANNFAHYLLQTKLKTRRLQNGRVVTYVTIPMTANHIEVRARRYLPIARRAARYYGVELSLVLAIMEVESSFNPYAVSSANAIGLMQVVPHTAGKDIFGRKGWSGQPNRSYLYNPSQNVDAGTLYLAILRDEYLNGIANPISKRYAIISAYNSGAGAVLRVFDQNRLNAINKINRLPSNAVFHILTTKHPSDQAKNYLIKVHNAQQKYLTVR